MRTTHRICLSLAALALLSCGEDDAGPTGPSSGAIELSLSMSGQDVDPDGCSVSVDDGTPQALHEQSPLIVSSLTPGAHTALLSCSAPNCSVAGDNPLSVTVVAGQTTEATFEVECAALVGSLEVSLVMAGPEPDPDGCTVSVDGGPAQRLHSGESATFSDLAAGTHEVTVADVAGNCQVEGGPLRSVAIVAEQTTEETLTVECDWRARVAVDLGTLCDTDIQCGSAETVGSVASDINDRGQVVGWSGPYYSAVLWNDGFIRELPSPGCSIEWGCMFTSAEAINDLGQIIVGACDKHGDNCGSHLWDESRQLAVDLPTRGCLDLNDLGQLVCDGDLWENGSVKELPIHARGINNHGQIVGIGAVDVNDSTEYHAVLWADGVITDLGTLGGPWSRATKINEVGQVIGEAEDSEGNVRPFIWETGAMTDLGTLGEPSRAWDINDRGQVVGWEATSCAAGTICFRAFLWEDGIITYLSTLGGEQSRAFGINESGQVAGWSHTSEGVRRATFWTPE